MRVILTFTTALLLSGCYYESPHPLGPAGTVPLDDRLIGAWRVVGEGTLEKLRVFPFDERSYFFEISDDKERGLGRAYFTEVGNVRFLNLVSIEEPGAKFMFVRYDWSGDTLRVRGIKDTAPAFASSAELQRWLTPRVDSAGIYERVISLVR